MSRSVDETRREFLLRLAKGAAFVPPALMTLDVSRVFGQKGATATGGPGKGAASTATQAAAPAQQATPTTSAVTGVSPQGGALRAFQVQEEQSGQPWESGRAAGSPPWSKPPPTQAGR